MIKRIQGCVALCKKSKMRMTFRKSGDEGVDAFARAREATRPETGKLLE